MTKSTGQIPRVQLQNNYKLIESQQRISTKLIEILIGGIYLLHYPKV